MATETDKKSALTDSGAPSVAKVGDGGRISRTRKLSFPAKRIKNKKRLFAYVLLAIVVVLGGWAVLKREFHVGEKIYAQVGHHKIYKQDIDALIGKNKGISNHDAATVLADKYLYETMAKEQGISITDKDIKTAYGPSIEQQKTQNKYAYQFRVNDLYYQKLEERNQGIYKGYLLVAHFSRNIALQPHETQSFPTNTGNAAAIAADKKYSGDFINKLYDEVKSHKLTWDQAAQMEKADPEIGTIMYPSLTHSGPFDTSKITNSLLLPATALKQVQKLKAGQTSKPFVVGVVSTVGDTNQYFESYFLVVRMDDSFGGGSSLSILQEITQAKQKLGYKVYV